MIVKNYLPRISDALLAKKLRHSGAVLITGPKWCGKTATASIASNSILYMQDPDRGPSYMKAAKHLKELARKVDDSKMGKPTFLMVLTGGEFAYQRKDGVLVVPIGCLKD